MNKVQEISATMGKEIKYSYFYSKYPFNRESLVNKVILYEGLISLCSKELLEDAKDLSNYKYIRIWYQQ